MKINIDLKSYQAGVKACSDFLIDASDQSTMAEELTKYVLPGGNWRKRFEKDVGIPGYKLKRKRR
jgi:hypothetical protein